jgi:signal peptidase I
MKYIATTFYTILIIFLMCVAAVFLASMVPIPGHISVKIVKSGSMEPAINVGSIVVVKPAERYQVGDVITFGADTQTQIPTTHRIIATNVENGATMFTTKGDANEDPDSNKTSVSEVQGKVVFTVPHAGFVLDFAKKPMGFTLMIAVPAAIIIVDELMRIFNEVRSMRAGSTPAKRREVDEADSPYVSIEDLQEIDPPTFTPRKSMDGVTRHRSL